MNRGSNLLLFAVFLSSVCAGQTSTNDASLMSLVESERAFAATSVKLGARSSFMMYFADAAVVFRPHPVKYKEAMKNVPLPKNPTEATLEWEPIWADISCSGDLGYTTGPSVWTDHSAAKRPTYYGFYFSFWKKQPTGEWKVVFDVGTELPGPYEGPRQFQSASKVERTVSPMNMSPQDQKSSLLAAETDFLKVIRQQGINKAIVECLDNNARIYRQKSQPLVGIKSIKKYFSEKPYIFEWKPLEAVVAETGDLGYSYGSYTVKNGSKPGDTEKGYVLHGWKRDASNRWRLVAEVISPLPPEEPGTKQ